MICPWCVAENNECQKTEVLETRQYWDPNDEQYYNERKRRCLNCSMKFTTAEKRVEDD